jgi:hypothetical protein
MATLSNVELDALAHSLACENAMTPQDAVNARLIGILMCCAKLVQNLEADAKAALDGTREAGSTTNSIFGLIQSIGLLGAHDGVQLEKDVLTLARGLGFEIQQQFMAKGSEVPQ